MDKKICWSMPIPFCDKSKSNYHKTHNQMDKSNHDPYDIPRLVQIGKNDQTILNNTNSTGTNSVYRTINCHLISF